MTTILRRVRAGIKLIERERQGRDLAVEAAAEVAPEIVKMAVGGTDDHLDQDLAHLGPLGVVQDLAQRREVGKDVHLVQGVDQGIAHDHHAEKGESREDLVPGADPSPVPVPETETVIVIETGIKAAEGDQGADHMTGHVTAGRGLAQGRHMREGGATVLAHGHVIVTVIGERLKPLVDVCMCVSACHITTQLLPLALWSGNRLTVPGYLGSFVLLAN